MSKIRQIVGKNIRNLREIRGFTQEGLAEMVDVSGSYIGYLERGIQSPSLKLLDRLANVLEVEPAVLLTKSEENVKDEELKKLIMLLSNKELGAIRFINEVATSYFRSLRDH